jgi:hypothetical protein
MSKKQGSAFYVNISNVTYANALDENGSVISPNITTLNGSTGSVLLRDMGRTVRISDPTKYVGANLVLRKVQIVENTINNFGGLNEGAAFYIMLSPVSQFARINM